MQLECLSYLETQRKITFKPFFLDDSIFSLALFTFLRVTFHEGKPRTSREEEENVKAERGQKGTGQNVVVKFPMKSVENKVTSAVYSTL